MQLLRITNVPIKITMRVQRARLEVSQQQPQVRINRVPSKLSMESRPIKVNIDTFEARYALGRKSAPAMIADAASEGMQAAQDATAQYAEIGNQMAQIQTGANLPDIMYSKLLTPQPTPQGFEPFVGPDISWEANSLSTEYSPTQLSMEAQYSRPDMQFVPGALNFNVEQYPRVQIEYLGKPIYVPPSASPDYKE